MPLIPRSSALSGNNAVLIEIVISVWVTLFEHTLWRTS